MLDTKNKPPATITMDEVAEMLQVTRYTVNRWIDSGAMPQPFRVGRRLIRWQREVIQDWIDAGCPAQNK